MRGNATSSWGTRLRGHEVQIVLQRLHHKKVPLLLARHCRKGRSATSKDSKSLKTAPWEWLGYKVPTLVCICSNFPEVFRVWHLEMHPTRPWTKWVCQAVFRAWHLATNLTRNRSDLAKWSSELDIWKRLQPEAGRSDPATWSSEFDVWRFIRPVSGRSLLSKWTPWLLNESTCQVVLTAFLLALSLTRAWKESTFKSVLPSMTFGNAFNKTLNRVCFKWSSELDIWRQIWPEAGVTLPNGLWSLTFNQKLDGVTCHVIFRVWRVETHSTSLWKESAFQVDSLALERVNLPSGLDSISFGFEFNQNLKGVNFPSVLPSVTFGNAFNKTLERVCFKWSSELDIWRQIWQEAGVTLPNGLRSLTFGKDFNQKLDGVTLPRDLQSLTCGDSFDQSLEGVCFPRRQVDSLALEQVNLPSGLDSISFGSPLLFGRCTAETGSVQWDATRDVWWVNHEVPVKTLGCYLFKLSRQKSANMTSLTEMVHFVSWTIWPTFWI